MTEKEYTDQLIALRDKLRKRRLPARLIRRRLEDFMDIHYISGEIGVDVTDKDAFQAFLDDEDNHKPCTIDAFTKPYINRKGKKLKLEYVTHFHFREITNPPVEC